MSGLFSALFLMRRGWEVALYERSPVPLTGRGAGIMTHPELHRAAAAASLDTARDFGVVVEDRVMLDAAGAAIARRRHPQTATSWNRLFEMLGAALGDGPYRLGRDLVRVSQDRAGVVAHFADGTSAEGDVLVGADGLRSAVRAQHHPEVRPLYAGYVAWRGLLDERAAVAVLTQELFDAFSFHLPPGEQFLGYPVAGQGNDLGNDLRPGHRSWNVVWYRPADEAADLPRLLTDAQGHTHDLSIPPPLVAPGVVAEMRAAAERLLPPQFRAAMALIPQPFLQPVYDLESARLAFGRVGLVGDAAFVLRPHVGGGVVKAAEDAAALAECLDAEPTVDAALRAYEARRLPVGRQFVAQARRLGSYLRYRFDTEEERAQAAAHAVPERVLAETATLDFLRR